MKSYLMVLLLILHPTLQLTVTSFEKSWCELGAKFSCCHQNNSFCREGWVGGRGKGKDKGERKGGGEGGFKTSFGLKRIWQKVFKIKCNFT